jgi:hypothetical protein
MSNYEFPSAFPPDHFVSEYIAYASQLTDAAHDYHEAVAAHVGLFSSRHD